MQYTISKELRVVNLYLLTAFGCAAHTQLRCVSGASLQECQSFAICTQSPGMLQYVSAGVSILRSLLIFFKVAAMALVKASRFSPRILAVSTWECVFQAPFQYVRLGLLFHSHSVNLGLISPFQCVNLGLISPDQFGCKCSCCSCKALCNALLSLLLARLLRVLLTAKHGLCVLQGSAHFLSSME